MDNSRYIQYNSQDTFFKNPFGALKCNTNVQIRIFIRGVMPNKVFLKIIKDIYFDSEQNEEVYEMHLDKENSQFNENIFICNITMPSKPQLIFYYFEINCHDKSIYYGNNLNNTGGVGKQYEKNPKPYQITVYNNSITPKWFMNCIIYQIFVDRFYNGNINNIVSNPKENSFIYGSWYDKPMYIKDFVTKDILRWDFYGGNLKGIIKKLDYLRELGISCIYLNPIFESSSNHKYDTGDYKKIDSMFGNENILKELVIKAKQKGINIILDGVFNHTGSDSIYFNKENKYDSVGAYNSKESQYYKWYKFNEYPNDYECWWGVKSLPSVNEMESSYVNFIIKDKDSVINKWMDTGIKGWRLDVADELPDEFIQEIKKECIKKDNNSVIIGEVWEDASNKISYNKRKKYFLNGELNSVTNYLFKNNIIDFLNDTIDASLLCEKFMSLYENYPLNNFYSLVNVIGTHDVERITTIMKDITERKLENINYFNSKVVNDNKYELTIKFLKIITLLQYTFPGVPLLYYGDEAGLEGGKDPENRACYPWGRIDKNIFNWYSNIISIRNKNKVLRTGYWKQFHYNKDVYGYMRFSKNGKDIFGDECHDSLMIVIINKNILNDYDIILDISEYNRYLNNKCYSFLNIINNKKIKLQDNFIKVNIKSLECKLLTLWSD